MDKTQLLTIVITALVSVLGKELITWLVGLVKGTAAVSSARAKLKAIFSKANRAVMIDVLSILFYVGVLVNFALGESAPTRLEVLLIIGAVIALIVMAIALLIDIAKIVHARNSSP